MRYAAQHDVPLKVGARIGGLDEVSTGIVSSYCRLE